MLELTGLGLVRLDGPSDRMCTALTNIFGVILVEPLSGVSPALFPGRGSVFFLILWPCCNAGYELIVA